MREEADKISTSFAKVTAKLIVNDLLISDIAKVEKTLKSIKETNEAIIYIYIMDENRNIIASTFGDMVPVGLKSWNILGSKRSNVVLLRNKLEVIHDVGVKILDNFGYEMHLGFTETGINELFKRVARKFMLYIAGIIFVVLLLSYLLSKFLTKPLESLYCFTNRLMNKEFGITIVPSGSFEVQRIIEAINNLSVELKNYHDNFRMTFNNLLLTEKINAFNTLKSGLLHEIKSSITSIKLLVSGLDENNIKNEDISIIRIETKNIEKLLKNLTGQITTSDIEIGFVNISEIITNILEDFKEVLIKKNIRVNLQETHDVKYIKGYYSLIEHLFINLLRNSFEAIEQDGVIDIAISYNEEDAVEIVFSDNGKGIPIVYISKIFDPFFTTKKDGTGMGLYIVYNIVKIHFGDISVESKEGFTSFKILLRGTL